MKAIASSIIMSSIIVLSACAGDTGRDYQSSAACAARGIKAADPGYGTCVREEAQKRRMDEQRREFEDRKQQEEFWRTHKY